ncbi:hypothetical protein [Nocardia abscessus]|uniref:hypothetical protein n=1 Tax=Nocardia abscessus TaxID=120957 RepID=UPI0024549B74|nr:hypothetical protein [Nocardia abscessus]
MSPEVGLPARPENPPVLPELRVGAPVAGLAPRPTVLLVAGFAVPRRRAGAGGA